MYYEEESNCWLNHDAVLNSTSSLSGITESRVWKIPQRVLASHQTAKDLEAEEESNWPQGYKAWPKIIIKTVG